MTPVEFKAWFDGFTEALDGVPSKAQWARIKERVAEIDGKPITERVFVDRYWPAYPAYFWHTAAARPPTPAVWTTLGMNTFQSNAGGETAAYGQVMRQGHFDGYTNGAVFNGLTAMNALGRADAQSLS